MGFGDTFRKEIDLKVKKKDMPEYLQKLVDVDRKIDSVSADKAAEMSSYNQQLKTLRKERSTLLDTIENGVATITVEVFERVNEQRGEVETVRVDTNQVLHEFTRAMTAAERQGDLFDGSDGDEPSDADDDEIDEDPEDDEGAEDDPDEEADDDEPEGDEAA